MGKRITPILLAAFALCVVGCKKGNGSVEMGTFTCKDVKDQNCVGATDTFDTSAEVIHFLHRTKDVPKRGDVYVIQWIATDVGEAAPANTVIDTVNEEVDDDVEKADFYVVTSHLSKPNKGWPTGTYRVEVKLKDKLVTTAKFSIK